MRPWAPHLLESGTPGGCDSCGKDEENVFGWITSQKAQNVFSVSQTGGAHNSGKSMAQKYKIMILEK
jgi:hypothetical protein